MRYNRVFIDAIAYEIPTEIISTRSLETKLDPIYKKLNMPLGHLEKITGVSERRFWPRGSKLSNGAAAASRKALDQAGIRAIDLGALVYASVCREYFEPATACVVGAELGIGSETMVYDISNACLAAVNAISDIANRIELGQIRCGLVASCETAREVNEYAIDMLLKEGTGASFGECLATLTGGSGASAVLLTDGSFPGCGRHRLVGGAARSSTAHHELCRWGTQQVGEHLFEPLAKTDSAAVLRHGVELGRATWRAFLDSVQWDPATIDRVVFHQVGRSHSQKIMNALELTSGMDYSTYQSYGNMGTVSVPFTAALAAESGHLKTGQRVGLLGIGSGLNCKILGVEW